MSKKIGNKKGLVLGAVLGATVGGTGALSPLLWNNQPKKSETIKVVDFETSNVGLNGATVKFKLDLNNLDQKTHDELNSKQKINVNIIDANTSIILDTLEATKNEKNEYTLDVNSLEPGKIYNLQVIDLGADNLIFDLNTDSGFIITKPELSSIQYKLDKRNASFEFIFSDEEKILLGKEIIVTFKEDGAPENEIKRLKGVVTLIQPKENEVLGKEKVAFIASTKENLVAETGEVITEESAKELKRNTLYNIEKILINGENISFNNFVDLDFKTTTPQSTVYEIKEGEKTINSTNGILVLNNLDQDVLNKRVNITFAEIDKNDNGDVIGYKNYGTLIDKLIEENDENSYKINLNLENLNPGASYRILRINSVNSDNSSLAVSVLLPQEENDKWILSTEPVVSEIITNTSLEKSAFIRVTLKDDSYTKNSSNAYLKYVLTSEVGQEEKIKIVESNIIGNFIRFNLTNLSPLLEYTILEVGVKVDETTNKPFEFDTKLEENSKKFIPTASNVIVSNVNVKEAKLTESSAKVVVEFEPGQEFILGRKVKLTLSPLGTNDEITYPLPRKNEENTEISEGVEIVKKNSKIEAEFNLDNLIGGTRYSIVGITIDEDPSKNVAENSLKVDFSVTVEGSTRRFTTKPTIKNINSTNSDTLVNLTISLNNSYNDEKSFENKKAIIKYKEKIEGNSSTDEIAVEGIVKANFIVLELKDLTPNKTFEITSIEVEGHQTSNNNGNLLEVSTNISENNKLFYTTATSANIINIENTPQSESTSTIRLTFDENSEFLNGRIIIMEYRKVNAAASEAPLQLEATIQDKVLTYNVSNLEIGTNYLITSLTVKRNDTDAPDKALTKIIYDAVLIKENDKIFRTTNGVKSFEFRTAIETKTRVIVSIADSNSEYLNKQVKIVYTKTTGNNIQDIISEKSEIINGKAIFDLSNLEKIEKYKIKEVKIVDDSSEQSLEITNRLTEENKIFTTSAQTAKISNIEVNEFMKTKNSTEILVSFNNDDLYFPNNEYILTLNYKRQGSKTNEEPIVGVLDAATKKYKFTFSNLKEGSVYYTVGFTGSKDGKNIQISQDDVSENQKQFATKATIGSINVNTTEEEKAKIYVRFNDANRDIVNKSLKIVAKKRAEKDNVAAEKYEAITNSNSGLYIFDLNNLPKLEELEIVGIYEENVNVEIPFGLEQENELNVSKVFRVSAQSATVNNVSISNIERTSASINIIFDNKDSFVNGKKVKLLFRGQDSTDIRETEGEGETISNNSATFNISNLKEGIRYEITGFKIEELKSNFDSNSGSNALLFNRTFVTKTVVSAYDVIQISETSARVIVSIEDIARVKENFKGKIQYHNNSFPSQINDSYVLSINNGRAVFEINGLEKSGTFTIDGFFISDQANNENTLLKLVEKDNLTTPSRDNNKIFTLVSKNSTITSVSSLSSLDSSIVKLKLGEEDRFTIGKNITLKIRKQGSRDEKVAVARLERGDDNNPTANLAFTGLESGTTYVLTGVEISDVPRTVFGQTITDFQKQIVTTPIISRLLVSSLSETSYQVNVIIRDPLSGSTDNRTFDNKKVRITYYADDNASEKLTAESTIELSRITFNLDNLIKSKSYTIEKIEYNSEGIELSSTLTAFHFLKSDVRQENKKFTVLEKTAQIIGVEFSNITNNSGTVKLKFSNRIDGYLNTKSKKVKINYRSSENSNNTVSELSSQVIENDFVIYTFNLNNLGHGSNIRIISAETETGNDVSLNFSTDISNDEKQFNTIPTVRLIKNYKTDEETSWNIEVRLKDLKETSENKKIKLVYYREDQENNLLTSEEFNINSNRSIVKINNLEKFINYKVKEIKLISDNPATETILDLESSIEENDKIFKVIPKIATITEIKEKAGTTNSVSFKFKFSEEDRNYLKEYNKITMNYRQKGQETVITKNNTVDPSTLESEFSFTVGQDDFLQASYEILSVIFEGDVANSSDKNVNNPNGVRITFDNNVNRNDKTFSTTTNVSSIVATGQETTGEVIVRVNDNSKTYVGSRLKVIYFRSDQESEEFTSNDAEIGVSSQQGKSEATVTLENLNKAYTYKIKKVLINNAETPFEDNFNENSKTFNTKGKTALVTSISGNENATSKDAATITLSFNADDKYLGGSNFVNPNLEAKSLYLLISSRNTGVVKTSTASVVSHQGDGAQVTFTLSELDSGDVYDIISLQEITGTPEASDIAFTFANGLNQSIKTLPTLGNVTKNVNVETKAILTVEVINLNDIVEPGSNKTGILKYKKVDTEEELEVQFTYSNKNSIDVEISDLQKNQAYELIKATIDNIDFNFNRASNVERNKQFTTNYKTAQVSISANSDKRESSGTFTLNFGNFDDYLNNGWKAKISYQVTDGLERKISNETLVNISDKRAVFEIENLSGGQKYHITDILITKDSEKVLARIENNDDSGSLVNTKASIREISYISSRESEANIIVQLDNTNLDIANNDEIIVEYELVQSIEGNNHQGTARANLVINNNNNNNASVTFNLTSLVKGREYKITNIKKASSMENIRFNTNINDENHAQRKFASISTTASVSAISFENIERNTANAVITFEDEFTKSSQQVSILYRKVGTNDTFNSTLVNISGDKIARANLTNLEAGARYEVIGGTLIPSSASVTISSTLENSNSNKFFTKPEISVININVSSETEATITITFTDEERSLNGNQVKLIIEPVQGEAGVGRNGASTVEVTATINSNHIATFNANNLNKFTEYSLKAITDESNGSNTIPYNNVFEENQELFSSRNFRTLAQNGRLTYVNHQYNGDVTTNSTSAKFNVNSDDLIFAKNRNISISYIEIDDQNGEVGNTIVSPQNVRISELGEITFNFTNEVNNIKSGTKYKIKEVNDLSPASERVNFSLENDIYFETLIEQPKVESITALKSEIDPEASANDLYKYTTNFEFKFLDPKNAIKWDDIRNWSVNITGKARNSSENKIIIDSNKIELSRKGTESILVVKIKSDDIREIVAREFTFIINNLTYSSHVDKSDSVIISSISDNSIGNKLTSSPISQLFIERIQAPAMLTSQSNNSDVALGFSFRVYDPKRTLRESQEYGGAGYAWVWSTNVAPFPGVATFEYQNGFGSNVTGGWARNSDDTTINNSRFITPGITKAASGFKLKQQYSKYQDQPWEEFKPSYVAISSRRETSDQNYVLISYIGVAKAVTDTASASFNITKMFRKNVRLKQDGVFALLKISVADKTLTGGANNFNALTGQGSITDITDGTTILRKDISTTSSTYSFPQWDAKYNYVLSRNQADSRERNLIIKRIPNISTQSSWRNDHIALTNVSYNNETKELITTFRTNDQLNYNNILTYAVFQDDDGNLYFAGDNDGNPKAIVTREKTITYKINPISVSEDEHAPSDKEMKFIGIWTQEDADNGSVIPFFSTVSEGENVNITFKITN